MRNVAGVSAETVTRTLRRMAGEGKLISDGNGHFRDPTLLKLNSLARWG